MNEDNRMTIQEVRTLVTNQLKHGSPDISLDTINDVLSIIINNLPTNSESYTKKEALQALTKAVEIIDDQNIQLVKDYLSEFIDDNKSDYPELKHVDLKIVVDNLSLPLEVNLGDIVTLDTILLGIRAVINNHHGYDKLAVMVLVDRINVETLKYHTIESFVAKGLEDKIYNPELAFITDKKHSNIIEQKRSYMMTLVGITTLYDRYLIRDREGNVIENIQNMWLRITGGLTLLDKDRDTWLPKVYDALSSLVYMHSTPTLFNAGLVVSQLSSCYLSTTPDSIKGIYHTITNDAHLSKHAGGVANDFTPVRAMGAKIKSTNGTSTGCIGFMKVVESTAIGVNQSGKRRGAIACYLSIWHSDFFNFCDLKKNTGDERRRTPDINTASWIPDLFMERVIAKEKWSLFSPDEVGDLHELSGNVFKERYRHYETLGEAGELHIFEQVPAVELWNTLLSRLFETGHPWVNFSDAFNLRYTNQHVGQIHSSNLCTEIGLHTNEKETAVCNLASINLEKHVADGKIDWDKLENTVCIAARCLDNVIDLNYNPIPEAELSNDLNRPIGIGILGTQYALHALDINMDSEEAEHVLGDIQEFISYHAILTSSKLAKERGAYKNYKGSLWDQDILPLDSYNNLMEYRGTETCTRSQMDWQPVRESIKENGMRNSNTQAIAPTACISEDTLTITSEGILPIGHYYDSNNNESWQTQRLRVAQEKIPQHCNSLFVNGQSKVYVVTTEEGTMLKATPTHRIRTFNNDVYEWKQMQDIVPSDLIVKKLGGHSDVLANKPVLEVPYDNEALALSDIPKHVNVDLANFIGILTALKHQTKEDTLQTSGWIGMYNNRDIDKFRDNDLMSYLADTYSNDIVHYDKIHGHLLKLVEAVGTELIPHLIAKSPTHVLKAYMEGFINNITYIDNTKYCVLLLEDQDNARTFKYVLESIGIQSLLLKDNLAITCPYRHLICSLISSSSEKHYGDETPADQIKSKNLFVERVSTVTMSEAFTLDFQVPVNNTYIANGLVSHNTISLITGTSPSIEPLYSNMYAKANLSGDFTIINRYMVDELTRYGLWDSETRSMIAQSNGSVASVPYIPSHLKDKYKISFEVDPMVLLRQTRARAKWIDQSQSHNVFIADVTGEKLENIYEYAWKLGNKSTYYLRTLAATTVRDDEVKYITEDGCDSCS